MKKPMSCGLVRESVWWWLIYRGVLVCRVLGVPSRTSNSVNQFWRSLPVHLQTNQRSMPHRPRTSPSWPCHHRPHKPHSRTSPRTTPDLCFVIMLQVERPVLWTNLWSCHGISPIPGPSGIVHGRVWTGECWPSPQPLAPLYWRHLCGLALQQDGTSRIPPPPEQPAATHQIYHGVREEQHHLLPGCSSHTQSRWHPCPHSTPQAYTHRPVSTQLFVPSSTL